MLTQGSILVSLLWLVEQIPTPPPPAKRQRGRQETYSDKLFVKALVVMIIRRLSTAYALLSFLDQDDPVVQQIRPLLMEHGRFPTRRTWERRFETLPARLPALIGCLGRHLVTLLQPWAAQGHAAAVDRTPLRANGGVWHKKHRLAGEVPHSSIDTEAAWSKSGYHGWWYGWKLHLAVSNSNFDFIRGLGLSIDTDFAKVETAEYQGGGHDDSLKLRGSPGDLAPRHRAPP
jgi:hypothetical protein